MSSLNRKMMYIHSAGDLYSSDFTPEQLSIAVSHLSPNYSAWLNKLKSGMLITDFENRTPEDFAGEIHSFSGLLLTGGGDIHPGLYGNPDIQGHCRNIDERRDKLEWKMIETALEHGLPILAVCRGMQMLNVFRGGTLITDIPAFVTHAIPHKNQKDILHTVSLNSGSLLYRITQRNFEMVNSSHHQALDRLAEGLMVSAFSPDGITEAIEFSNNPPVFCVGVQWHPERMDIHNPLSGMLGRAFIDAVLKMVTRDS